MRCMWIILLLSIGAVVLAGCSRVVFPGDGRLVIVEIDPVLDNCPLRFADGNFTTIGAVVRSGIRYWDEAGARFRTRDQLQPQDRVESAPKLQIQAEGKITDLGKDELLTGDHAMAEYDYGGTVILLLRRWSPHLDPYGIMTPATVIAHEIGHAMGLDHVDDPAAVMYWERTKQNSRVNLADADLREYARVWP